MLNTETLLKKLVSYITVLRQRYGDTNLYIGLVIVTLILFGDTLLPIFGHFLQLILHITEAFLEHVLERWFHATPRQAEFIIFWSGMAVALYVGWKLSGKAYRWLKSAYMDTKRNWQTLPKKYRYLSLVCITCILVVTNM